MQNIQPIVSIITPNYNGQKFIKNTIESVINQTFKDWEMLIVDDGSTDNSKKIINKYVHKDARIKLLTTDIVKFPKFIQGPASARNTAIDAAQGRYIAFVDSDDLWYEDKLAKQILFLKENNYAIASTWYDIINELGEKVGENAPCDLKLSYEDLLKNCKVGCLTMMFDTQKIGKQFIDLNRYDKNADYSLWLKITKQGYNIYFLHNKLSAYRLVKGSISANKFKAIIHQWIMLRKVEKLNFLFALYNFFFYLKSGLSKKLRYNLTRLFNL